MKNEQKYKTPSKHDTIADILAYMRECADGTEKHGLYDLRDYGTDYLRALADNIEAAMKREREAGADAAQICGEIGEMIGSEAAGKDSLQVGNAAKMREALRGLLEIVCIDCNSSYKVDGKCVKCPRVVAAEAAISAPPRNCDIGTAEEQHERFYNFCDKVEECKECPLWRGGGLTSKCCAHWGQMPYEEGGAE